MTAVDVQVVRLPHGADLPLPGYETPGSAGMDLAEMDAAITADEARLERAIADNEAAQKAAGHWGVPLMVFQGEPFFGQDRIDLLLWRMRQHGLEARAGA